MDLSKQQNVNWLRQLGFEVKVISTKSLTDILVTDQLSRNVVIADTAEDIYGCQLISDDRRSEIHKAYYGLTSLQDQRKWPARHLTSSTPSSTKEMSRKSTTISYFLPVDDKGDVVRVCRVLFTNTLRVTDRQIRTVISKIDKTGVISPENRGGRTKKQQSRDRNISNLVDTHINKFPRVESHYCRRESSCKYLSFDLSLTKMHTMYLSENTVS